MEKGWIVGPRRNGTEEKGTCRRVIAGEQRGKSARDGRRTTGSLAKGLAKTLRDGRQSHKAVALPRRSAVGRPPGWVLGQWPGTGRTVMVEMAGLAGLGFPWYWMLRVLAGRRRTPRLDVELPVRGFLAGSGLLCLVGSLSLAELDPLIVAAKVRAPLKRADDIMIISTPFSPLSPRSGSPLMGQGCFRLS